MATDWPAFRALANDEASEAFRIASEDDRPMRVLCPLPGVHDVYREAGRAARRAAHLASREAGIAAPQIRWFKEVRLHPDEPPVCGGMILRGYPGIVWLNVGLSLQSAQRLEHTTCHEVAHLAGYLSEADADAFAERVSGVSFDEAGCRDGRDSASLLPQDQIPWERGARFDSVWDLHRDGYW